MQPWGINCTTPATCLLSSGGGGYCYWKWLWLECNSCERHATNGSSQYLVIWIHFTEIQKKSEPTLHNNLEQWLTLLSNTWSRVNKICLSASSFCGKWIEAWPGHRTSSEGKLIPKFSKVAVHQLKPSRGWVIHQSTECLQTDDSNKENTKRIAQKSPWKLTPANQVAGKMVTIYLFVCYVLNNGQCFLRTSWCQGKVDILSIKSHHFLM